ncbi:MAG: alkene reductase [Leptospirillum sp.]|jgi:N-ethylmaleimide reductase
MNQNTVDLFSPYQLGTTTLPNRMVMAPMTRSRAGEGNTPTPLMATYYEQRATAGLIITEATQISPGGQGYIQTPGIHSPEQIAGWKKVTEAVHQKGGVIYLQLWHVGRISHPDFLQGNLPVAPSAIAPRGMTTYTPTGPKEIPTPRALEIHEIAQIVEQYKIAAKNAKEAGFDGVEIHGANGYLIDQFLEDSTNQRTDLYGGSVENRARFLFEVIEAATSVWGSQHIGLRLSPGGTFNDMHDSNPQKTFGYVLQKLSKLNLAYVHLIEPAIPEGEHPTPDLSARFFRPLYSGTLIVAGDYSREKGNIVLKNGFADLVAFGRPFLANPDLVERFKKGERLNPIDTTTFYGGGVKGYTDYPSMD